MSSPPDSSKDRIFSPLSRVVRALVSVWLILAGLWYAVSSLVAIASFAWPQLAYDQFRLYTFYLGLPFPENVLMLENGHRPIIPALLRVFEVHAFAANQYFQIAVGTCCAALTATIVAICAWREPNIDMRTRAAGFALALVAIFWLGNARMLLHGNELVHAYLVTLCLVAGTWMVRRAAVSASSTWMLGAALAATIATFSFGPGITLFPTFIALAWLLRAPSRQLAILITMAGACLALYLFALPGDGGVRASLDFRPIDSLVVAARWLSSPWITGWLGMADPQTHQIAVSSPLGITLKSTANFLQSVLHLQWRDTGATLIGLSGLGALAVALFLQARRRYPLSSIQTYAFALMMFGAATAIVIGIGRVGYLDKYPDQIFADRYLLWTCLFWLGLCLLLLSIANSRRALLRSCLLTFACLLPVALLPFHQYGAGWGAAVYRSNQASAAAALSDVFDETLFYDDDAATLQQRVLSYRLLREGHLGPFRIAGNDELGHLFTSKTIEATPGISVTMQRTFAVIDARDKSVGARFDGVVSAGIKAIRSRGPLVVIGPDQRIVGYAEFSYIGKPVSRWRLSTPMKRGFDGYVKDYDPTVRYWLVSMDRDGIRGRGWVLAELPAVTR